MASKNLSSLGNIMVEEVGPDTFAHRGKIGFVTLKDKFPVLIYLPKSWKWVKGSLVMGVNIKKKVEVAT